jgi:hypothetical protein
MYSTFQEGEDQEEEMKKFVKEMEKKVEEYNKQEMKVLAMDVLAYETFIVCASGRDQ